MKIWAAEFLPVIYTLACSRAIATLCEELFVLRVARGSVFRPAIGQEDACDHDRSDRLCRTAEMAGNS